MRAAPRLSFCSKSFRSKSFRSWTLRSTAAAALGVTALAGFAAIEEAGAETATAAAATGGFVGYADVVAPLLPAVVNVVAERAVEQPSLSRWRGEPEGDRRGFRDFGPFGPSPDDGPGRVGQGSGFVVDPDGLIVTNAHVVDGARAITVTLQDGTELEAALLGLDQKTDLALLKVSSGEPLPSVAFAEDDDLRVGDAVLAVGNPFGLGGTVTAGIVSATGREIGAGPYDDFIQIDAPINRGNSGGPTFALDGDVIGVNTAIFSPSGGNVGIGFAIPAGLAKAVIDDLADDGVVERGWLGVSLQGLDEDLSAALELGDAEGALVTEVIDGSPAAEAGVEAGDLIVGLGDVETKTPRDLARVVADAAPDAAVELEVLRDGEALSLDVVLGALDQGEREVASIDEAPRGRIGVELAPLGPRERERAGLDAGEGGAVIARVRPGGPAAEKGLRPGDVVVSVDGAAVTDPVEAADAVRAAAESGADAVVLDIRRNGRSLWIAAPFERG